MQILLVCHGNICRSAYGEYILREDLRQMHVTGVTVFSRGLLSLRNAPMSQRYASRLATNGIDSSRHRSRPVTDESIRHADLILTFTQSQSDEIIDRDINAFGKVFVIDDFANLCNAYVHGMGSGSPSNPEDRLHDIIDSEPFIRPSMPRFHDIKDPYRREDAVYDAVAHDIERCSHAIAAALSGIR